MAWVPILASSGWRVLTPTSMRNSYATPVGAICTKITCEPPLLRRVNALLHARQEAIWGETTSTCASDSKKFHAVDQNLLTQWHARYRGPGVLVYWHVERRSVCIYSQLKSCTSSEVAAMLEGVLRHCADMQIKQQMNDSHGRSASADAFS